MAGTRAPAACGTRRTDVRLRGVRPNGSPYSPSAAEGKRQSQATPMKVSAAARAKAAFGAAPAAARATCASTAVVKAGAMTCGRMTARFQMPMVVASAPGGRMRHAIDQSAAKKMPHPNPATSVAAAAPANVCAAMNPPSATTTIAPPAVATSRLSKRSDGRAAAAAPSAPMAVNARISSPLCSLATASDGVSNTPVT